jgi:hypothetical protein
MAHQQSPEPENFIQPDEVSPRGLSTLQAVGHFLTCGVVG